MSSAREAAARSIREEARAGHLVVVAGAGVAASTTTSSNTAKPAKASMWKGLLETGVIEGQRLDNIPDPKAQVLRMMLGLDDGPMLISVADQVTEALGGRSHGAYSAWLQKTVGALQPHRRQLIEALGALGCPIATTNYDGLLEAVLSRHEILWTKRHKVDRWLRKEDGGVLHLHGHWDDPETVVLDTLDYHAVASDDHAKATLRTLWMQRTLLFVGCGGTLSDPNFGALLRWATTAFRQIPRTHKLLLSDGKDLPVDAQLLSDARVEVVRYGPSYDDLPTFLGRCRPRAKGAGVTTEPD